jgi:uracil-DNA glycosylase family 4
VGELLDNLRQLVELDRGFGIEFTARPAVGAAAPAAPPLRAPAPAVRPAPAPAAAPAATPAAAAPVALAPRPAIPAPSGLPAADLAALAQAIAGCRACRLCEHRTRTVPGEGAPAPELVFVGEGPGADEDASGRPFVGPAGQLLDRMIGAMGLKRDEVFICNVVKCRPPGNRQPEADEAATCMPFLEAQLAVLRPKVICLLGATPLAALLGLKGITRLRGQRQEWRGTPVIPTFHPAYLLRNPEAKKPAWDDLKAVLALLGRSAPGR